MDREAVNGCDSQFAVGSEASVLRYKAASRLQEARLAPSRPMSEDVQEKG